MLNALKIIKSMNALSILLFTHMLLGLISSSLDEVLALWEDPDTG